MWIRSCIALYLARDKQVKFQKDNDGDWYVEAVKSVNKPNLGEIIVKSMKSILTIKTTIALLSLTEEQQRSYQLNCSLEKKYIWG